MCTIQPQICGLLYLWTQKDKEPLSLLLLNACLLLVASMVSSLWIWWKFMILVFIIFWYEFILKFLVGNQWTTPAVLSQARWNLCATWASQFVFFAGGQVLEQLSNVVDIYDLSMYTWIYMNKSLQIYSLTSIKYMVHCYLVSCQGRYGLCCIRFVFLLLLLICYFSLTWKENAEAYFAGGVYQFFDPLAPLNTFYTNQVDIFHPPNLQTGIDRYHFYSQKTWFLYINKK